jgi:hypothetical protein
MTSMRADVQRELATVLAEQADRARIAARAISSR